MNGAETSRVQEHSFAFQEPSAADDQISTLSDELKDSENIVHRPIRMLRRFPEESGEMLLGHRQQDLLPSSETTCICPEVLTKGTLVAIIGSLAFLGFFSTLVLLLVAVVILRLLDRQWKKEKKEKKDTDVGPKRSLPPVPRRPSEPVYLVPKSSSKYQPMRSVNQTAEESYVDPKDLHPGPRIRQEGKYTSSEGTGAETKSPPEKAYTSMHAASLFSTSPPEKAYTSMNAAPLFSTSTPEKAYSSMQSAPLFSTSTPENAYTGVQPAPVFSIPSPEHVYASIHRSQAEPSYTNIDEPRSEFMADASFATEEQTKGPEEHPYEEVN